jgi:recombination protein RecR
MASVLPPALDRLVRNLSRLPGIGEKTASRLAMQILRWPEKRAAELADSIATLHGKIRRCSVCFTFSEKDPCPVCSDPSRDTGIICVVEEPGDMLAMEKAGAFRGRYHVLHGAIAPMDGIGPEELRINRLAERIGRDKISEVIIATSSTVPVEATASCITDELAGTGVRISRIACGIPMGMDIKYADDMTLQKAIGARTEMVGTKG